MCHPCVGPCHHDGGPRCPGLAVLLMPLSCRWCCHMCVLLLPMQERLTRAEWVAAAIASLGILCLGLSSEPGPTPSPSPPAATGVSPGASPAGVAEGGTTQAAQIQAAAVAGALSSSARAGAAGGAAPLPDAGEARAALLVRGSLQGSGSRFYRVGGGGHPAGCGCSGVLGTGPWLAAHSCTCIAGGCDRWCMAMWQARRMWRIVLALLPPPPRVTPVPMCAATPLAL